MMIAKPAFNGVGGLRRRRGRHLLLPLLIASLLFLVWYIVMSSISKRERTVVILYVLSERIEEYVRQHRQLPSSVNALPLIENKTGEVHDAWGRVIEMQIVAGRCRLRSFGRDGRDGGRGDDSDICLEFDLCDENGRFLMRRGSLRHSFSDVHEEPVHP